MCYVVLKRWLADVSIVVSVLAWCLLICSGCLVSVANRKGSDESETGG